MKLDDNMKRRSRLSGVINIGAFAFAGLMELASPTVKTAEKTVSNTKCFTNSVKAALTNRTADIASVHAATHFSFQIAALTS